jgi:hypothetical protein
MAKSKPTGHVKLPKKVDALSREADRMQRDPHYIENLSKRK